jgi:hypothetical protein
MTKLTPLLLLITFLASQFLYLHRERQIAGEWGLALDDSWIHMVFARNLSGGHGYSFNPDRPLSGSTSPLWTLLLSASFLVTGASLWSAKLLGAALFLFSVILTYKLAKLMWSDERAALLSGVLVALCPYLNWGALSGMEVSLYVALSLWGVYLHLVNREKSGVVKYSSTLVLTLAGLARPECFLLLLIVWGEDFLLTRIHRHGHRFGEVVTQFLPHLVLFALLTAPYFAFNLRTVNSPFPSSYAAKTGSGGVLGELFRGDLRGAVVAATIKPIYMLIVSVGTLLSDNPVLSLVFLFGLLEVSNVSRRRNRGDLWLLPSLLVLIPLGMGLFGHVKALGQSNRYAAHLFPFFIITASGGLFSLPKLVSRDYLVGPRGRRTLYVMGTVLLALYAVFLLTRQHLVRFLAQLGPLSGLTHLAPPELLGYFAEVDTFFKYSVLSLVLPIVLITFFNGKDRCRKLAVLLSGALFVLSLLVAVKRDIDYAGYYAYNVKNINDLHVTTGRWLNENTPPEAIIAVNDIGGIGYFARREIIDLIGMATPEIIPYRMRGEPGIIDYFKEVRKPDYLVIYPEWFPLIDSMKESFKRIREFKIMHNTVCIHDRHFVYEVTLSE